MWAGTRGVKGVKLGGVWGIDVIAGVYGLATLVLVWLSFIGSEIGRVFGMLLSRAVWCFSSATFILRAIRFCFDSEQPSFVLSGAQ